MEVKMWRNRVLNSYICFLNMFMGFTLPLSPLSPSPSLFLQCGLWTRMWVKCWPNHNGLEFSQCMANIFFSRARRKSPPFLQAPEFLQHPHIRYVEVCSCVHRWSRKEQAHKNDYREHRKNVTQVQDITLTFKKTSICLGVEKVSLVSVTFL